MSTLATPVITGTRVATRSSAASVRARLGGYGLSATRIVVSFLFARPAAVLASGTMAYAYFTVHQHVALLPIQNNGEPAALYSWLFLMFAIVGPGTIAVDTLRKRAKKGA